MIKFPTSRLYADPDGSCYAALGFSPGFELQGMELPASVKLTGMLAGVGSPGTIQEVRTCGSGRATAGTQPRTAPHAHAFTWAWKAGAECRSGGGRGAAR